MIVKHKINMDLTIRRMIPRLSMVQCDTDARVLELWLTAGGTPWEPEALTNVFLRYRKSDGTGGSYDTMPDGSTAWSMEENRLTIRIAPQMLTVPGLVEVQAALLKDSCCVATFGFQIAVEEDPSMDVTASEDYINWVRWSQGELDQRLAQARSSGDFDGATFTPAVDARGWLTWSNDQQRQNPEAVDVVGLLADRLGEDTFLRRSGGVMSGDLNMGGCRVTGVGEPQQPEDAANRGFVDSLIRSGTVTLPALAWENNAQTTQVSGVTADNLVLITPAPQSWETCALYGIRCSAQEEGLLTFVCEVQPDTDAVMYALMIRKGETE